ncbi:MAG: DUF4190 domain-containing protein [Tepidisphaera sp.]|nr:DUF4190 domain-containing protein [Tepidisphaera sp.]
MSQFPPNVTRDPSPYSNLRPHRGTLILVFGILGLVMCFAFGVAAWIMGSSDLREMNAGSMDPSGREMTNAGKILGIISVCLQGLGLLIAIAVFAMGIIGAAAAAGSHP